MVLEDAHALDWHPGDIVLDHFEILELLGEGGMGKVYKVHHRGWKTNLAVKVPRPKTFTQQRGLEMFERECETWSNLGLHPHTVHCYFVRRYGTVPLVFAEFIEGGSLHNWIRSGRLYKDSPDHSLLRAVDIAIQMAWGLHHAHEQALVHQDVKPGNVMMTEDRIAKVTDFGLARARALVDGASIGASGYEPLVSSGGMTPAYCSPEQASLVARVSAGGISTEDGHITTKSDIWSCLYYHS